MEIKNQRLKIENKNDKFSTSHERAKALRNA